MERKELLETLRNQLLRRGLPGDYVSRAVRELADHHTDLVEAQQEPGPESEELAWQKLGDVERLSDELVRKYQSRSFAGRHPLFTFVVAPLPAMVALWVATFFAGWYAVFGIAQLLGNQMEALADTNFLGATWPLPTWLLLTIHYAIEALPPAICAWWFCRLARRSGRGLAWGIAACGLVILLACLVYSDLQMPKDGKREGMMLLVLRLPLFFQSDWQLLQSHGLWHCLGRQFAHFERQIPQVLAPLMVLLYVAWRARRLVVAPGSMLLEQRVAA